MTSFAPRDRFGCCWTSPASDPSPSPTLAPKVVNPRHLLSACLLYLAPKGCRVDESSEDTCGTKGNELEHEHDLQHDRFSAQASFERVEASPEDEYLIVTNASESARNAREKSTTNSSFIVLDASRFRPEGEKHG